MRLVIQRVSNASVSVNNETVSEIGTGLLVLVGIEPTDSEEDIDWLASKTVNMRIFPDNEGIMNRSVLEVNGEILAVSQFTLTASTRKGNRPSYIRAANSNVALPTYDLFCNKVSGMLGTPVKKGVFGADMQVSLINDGPVTIIIDSKLRE